jgi:hypothetical protein
MPPGSSLLKGLLLRKKIKGIISLLRCFLGNDPPVGKPTERIAIEETFL